MKDKNKNRNDKTLTGFYETPEDDWGLDETSELEVRAKGSQRIKKEVPKGVGRYSLNQKSSKLHSKESIFQNKRSSDQVQRDQTSPLLTKRRMASGTQAPECGDVIGGRFRIQRHLKTGGMGSVFEASHCRLDNRVCIKTIEEQSEMIVEAKRAFYREARFTSSLSHPNLIQVLDYDEDDIYGPFIVMELVEGKLLSDLVDSGYRFSVSEVCLIGAQIADALDYVHSQGVFHGDIKTSNIILQSDVDGYEKVKLIDFGLARSQSIGDDDVIVGTPEYMAPELCLGEPISQSTDIYALGILLYELACGEPPFRGAAKDILVSQINQPPPRPSTKSGRSIPMELEQWIVMMLSKEAGLRPKSSNEVRAMLKRLKNRSLGAHNDTNEDAALDAFYSTGCGRLVLDDEMTVIAANRAMGTLVQCDNREYIGLSFKDSPLSGLWEDSQTDVQNASKGQIVAKRIDVKFGDGHVDMFLLLEPTKESSLIQITLLPMHYV